LKGIQLTTYNSRGPIHGGKIRSKAILEIFAATFGANIEAVNKYAGLDARGRVTQYRDLPYLEDLLTSEHLELASLEEFEGIEYIVVEQPWGWPIAHRLKQERADLSTIYSSQNIESILKRRMLGSVEVEVREAVVAEIEKLELQAAHEADLVLACSRGDHQWFLDHGVNPKKILYIPNCTSADKFTPSEFNRSSEVEYFLLAGSSYLPTIESFMDLFSTANNFLPPATEIRVVGGITDYLAVTMGSHSATNLTGGVRLLGVVDDKTLHAQLSGALGMILPVKFGGGTNLKTAEALYYNKYIIGTEEAFRGFEEYLPDPKIYIVSDAHEAMRAVWKISNEIREKGFHPTKGVERSELTWTHWKMLAPQLIREALSA